MIGNATALTLLYGTSLNAIIATKHRDIMGWKEYLLNYGIIGLLYIPTSFAYNNVLNKFRLALFTEFTPYQQKHFSQMYFVSKPALMFDLFFIHFIYQSCFAVSLFTICQKCYTLQHSESEQKEKHLLESLVNLIKLRCGLSLFSVLIDIWLPQFELRFTNYREDPKEILISKKYQKIYGSKHAVFNILWQYGIIYQYIQFAQKEHVN